MINIKLRPEYSLRKGLSNILHLCFIKGGETAGLDSKEAEYSDNFEESEKTGEQSSPEPAKQLQDEAPAPKPSMLSKGTLCIHMYTCIVLYCFDGIQSSLLTL